MVIEIPKFHYKAVSRDGQILKGVLESRDHNRVIDLIRSKSLYPLEIKEIYEKKDFWDLDLWGSISSKDLSIFCKQLASMLKAGVPISEALDILANHTSNRRLRSSVLNVNRLIHTGVSLSESLYIQGKRFPNIFIRAVQASEISGTLDISLERMAIYFQREYTITQKLKKALLYPTIVTITAIWAIFFLIKTVVPQFMILFQSYNIDLPIPTRIVLGIYHFISSYGILVLISPIIVYITTILIRINKENRIRLHEIVLKLPFIGKIIQKALSARFNRLLAMLIANGIPLTNALDITAKTIGNAFMEHSLEKVLEEIRRGKGLGYSLNKMSIFPAAVSKIISIGEESGRLEEMMENIADFYEIEVDSLVERVIALLEPLLVLVLGGIIAIIIMAISLPMLDMFKFAG